MPAVDHLWAPAKLTRSLRIVGMRADGYHLLDTEMASLDLADELEIEDGAEGLEVINEVAWVGDAPAQDQSSGLDGGRALGTVPADQANIVAKALAAVGRRARVRLRKRIPAGAGLGGGSSDAAAVLRWAGASDPATAVGLGADVPFCLLGGRARVGGIGDRVEPLGFEAFSVVLVTPALCVSTPEVYRCWDALGGPHGEHGNDLEPAALVLEPRLIWWRDLIAAVAAERPNLAGSGGTWYLERAPDAARKLATEIAGAVREEHATALVAAAASAPRQ
jgi:4-diphosphocytidyl-2-C-methyl-D-erythritol kinase